MRKKQLLFLVLLFLTSDLWLVPFRAFASGEVQATAPKRPRPVFWRPTDWDWMQIPWSRNDAKFIQVRSYLERSYSPSLIKTWLLKYEKESLQNEKDPLAQFRWGYTYYLAQRHGMLNVNESIRLRSQVPFAMFNAPAYDSYEYTRLRFLIQARDRANTNLIAVGKRLVAHSPSDIPVKGTQATLLALAKSSSDRQQAVDYAEELIRANPSNSRLLSLRGGVYTRRWWTAHQREDAEKAIVAYEDYLRVAPKEEPFRQDAERFIRTLKGELSKP